MGVYSVLNIRWSSQVCVRILSQYSDIQKHPHGKVSAPLRWDPVILLAMNLLIFVVKNRAYTTLFKHCIVVLVVPTSPFHQYFDLMSYIMWLMTLIFFYPCGRVGLEWSPETQSSLPLVYVSLCHATLPMHRWKEMARRIRRHPWTRMIKMLLLYMKW